MKIVQYCQHVLGIGHFFRTLEICRALWDHEVILVTGGEAVDVSLPAHVREVRLPGLRMDENFSAVHAAGSAESVESVMEQRRKQLRDLFQAEAPDVFLVELYPFGRKKFRFELDPVLSGIRDGTLPPCRVVCSLRDILVEKSDTAGYEDRVVRTLNRYFDALLIHSDPALVRLEETFSRVSDLTVPVIYTGFVTPKPAPDARERIRRETGIGAEEQLIVASVGGGRVGARLLEATIAAFLLLERRNRLRIFTGPLMEEETVKRLKEKAGSEERITIERFTPDFPAWLAAADLSLSMAGYNTSMNLMAARVPALVWPFAQNREQRLRAERLAPFGGMKILDDTDLEPARLAGLMTERLRRKERPVPRLDLNGAENTRDQLSAIHDRKQAP